MLKRIGRYVVGTALIALFVMGPMSLYFWYKIPNTPTAPDSAKGLVFPYNNHGVTHYVSWFDHVLTGAFGFAAATVAVILIVAIIAANIKSNS